MPRELSDLRILLVHEWLYTWAGAERVLEELVALMPHADVLCGVVTDEIRREHAIAARARETWVGAIPGARSRHRWFLPLHAAAFATFDAQDYDLIISVTHAFEKLVRARKGAKHVAYCLSPPRYLWDLREAHDRMATWPQRLALRAAAPALRLIDRSAANGVDAFVSISQHVADRVGRSYGKPSEVVYPPVRPRAQPSDVRGSEPFILSLGRLVPYKRTDLAILAAEKLGIRLIVAGDGPERRKLERLGGKHTQFTGRVTESEASRLLAECSAFVFCAEEDFGIAPLEANAYGKPVIAFRRGATTETLVEGRSAVFFDRQDVDDVADATKRCLEMNWDERSIEQNAQRFAPDRFRAEMRSALQRALAN